MAKFIVFEGIDGAGKSTQIEMLKNKLKNAYFTFEPTDSPVGKLCKEMWDKVPAEALAMMLSADRDIHVYGEGDSLNNLLEYSKYKYIICDRYYFSTYAYQGSQGADPNLLIKLNEDFPLPDIVFYFDIDPKISVKRLKRNKETFENVKFLSFVRDNYKGILEEVSDIIDIVEIDATQDEDAIHDLIMGVITK